MQTAADIISHSARRLKLGLLLLQLVVLPVTRPQRLPACCRCRPGCRQPPAAHAGLLLGLPLPLCCLQTIISNPLLQTVLKGFSCSTAGVSACSSISAWHYTFSAHCNGTWS